MYTTKYHSVIENKKIAGTWMELEKKLPRVRQPPK